MSIVPKDSCEPITPEMWAQLRAAWPNGARLTAAWRLACDLETLASLLRGEPVDQSRLDQAELQRARRKSLVQLVAPIELVAVKDAA